MHRNVLKDEKSTPSEESLGKDVSSLPTGAHTHTYKYICINERIKNKYL